ncbi:MAG: DUF1616 domain-containing protein, partial [Candidatus Desulforudis sp.]|nr:DUF1616 domain-containing protein [Desulforudis sp.]
GIPFVFIFPGYTLLAALFPGGDGPGALERLMLSVGLSVVILIVGGLFLNNGFRGIDEFAVFAYLFVFVTAMSILASYRRWRAAA